MGENVLTQKELNSVDCFYRTAFSSLGAICCKDHSSCLCCHGDTSLIKMSNYQMSASVHSSPNKRTRLYFTYSVYSKTKIAAVTSDQRGLIINYALWLFFSHKQIMCFVLDTLYFNRLDSTVFGGFTDAQED